MNQLFTTINISRVPAIYRAITKSRKTKQWLAIPTIVTTRTISISSFSIPSIFTKVKTKREILDNAI